MQGFLPKIQRDRLKLTKDVVPPGLRSMDYWQIMDYWKIFDKNGDGQMDRNEFYHLMNRMSPDPMPKPLCDQMFSSVDADNSGEIDCEEFLSWIFQMYAPYSGGLRERLGDMDPQQVVAYFRSIDTNGNGELDKGEFFTFLTRFYPEARMTAKESSDLFDVIDVDRSGEIDAEEFVRWVYPGLPRGEDGRRPSKELQRAQQARPSPSKNHKDAPKQITRAGSMPVLTRRPGSTEGGRRNQAPAQPVVLEFTIGPDFKPTMLEIQKVFSRKFADTVSTKIVIDKDSRGCSNFTMRVGRGVVLWDKPTMMAHRDNPFESFESSKTFVMETIKERMPSLLKAANMGGRK